MDAPATPWWRAIQAYYLATPAFAVLDFAAGVNVRTAFLDGGPLVKLLYYAFAFACGLAVTRWPGRAPLVGLIESGGNIAWLIIGVGTRYLAALDAAASEAATLRPPFEGWEIVNLVGSAAVLTISYLVATARIGRPGQGSAGGGIAG